MKRLRNTKRSRHSQRMLTLWSFTMCGSQFDRSMKRRCRKGTQKFLVRNQTRTLFSMPGIIRTNCCMKRMMNGRFDGLSGNGRGKNRSLTVNAAESSTENGNDKKLFSLVESKPHRNTEIIIPPGGFRDCGKQCIICKFYKWTVDRYNGTKRKAGFDH